jgi:hypothetical protein
MPKYTFDVEMFTSITVEADTEQEAEELICEKLDQAEANFGAWDNGDPILGDIGLPEDALALSSTDEDDDEADED